MAYFKEKIEFGSFRPLKLHQEIQDEDGEEMEDLGGRSSGRIGGNNGIINGDGTEEDEEYNSDEYSDDF